MATKTKADLARKVLQALGEIDATQDPAPEDATYVQSVYSDLLVELRDREIATWDENAIPARVFRPLVKLVASECADTYGREYNAADAFNRLTVLAAKPDTGEATAATYF